MEEAAVALERVNWTTERKDFESKNRPDLTSEYYAALENELDLPSTSEIILDNAGISKTTLQIFNFGNEEQSGELKVNPPLATTEQKQQERLDSIPKLNFTVPSEEKKKIH